MSDPPRWEVRPASTADTADVLALTREVFTAYGDLVPQPSSLRETADDVQRDLAGPGGLVVRDGSGRLAGAARFGERDGALWLRRVVVAPDLRRQGVAAALTGAAEQVARSRGHDRLRLGVRLPLVDVQAFWRRRGFHVAATHGYWVELHRRVPVDVVLASAADTGALGRRLATFLRAGDLVLLSGDLGAGKTTLTRGLGAALGVRGAVTSPTFVIARVHPALGSGPALVHVDAYRLGDQVEVDDLDLDASLDDSVTVVEWGAGRVERLAEDRLEVVLSRNSDPSDETRMARIRPVGPRWDGVALGTPAADRA